jgi:hypothetical protein
MTPYFTATRAIILILIISKNYPLFYWSPFAIFWNAHWKITIVTSARAFMSYYMDIFGVA